MSIIAFFVSLAGKIFAKKVAEKQRELQRARLARELRARKIRVHHDVGHDLHQVGSVSLPGSLMQLDPEEINQMSVQELNQFSYSSIRRGRAAPVRANTIFVVPPTNGSTTTLPQRRNSLSSKDDIM